MILPFLEIFMYHKEGH